MSSPLISGNEIIAEEKDEVLVTDIERQQVQKNLYIISAAFHQWLIENGKHKKVTYKDVAGIYIDPAQSVVGESYDSLSAIWGHNPFIVTLPNKEVISFRYMNKHWRKENQSVFTTP